VSDVQFFNYLLVGALYKYSHCLRSAFFWDFTRSRVVIVYLVPGQHIDPILQESRVREDGTDTLSRKRR
jgi:hypothetical protein